MTRRILNVATGEETVDEDFVGTDFTPVPSASGIELTNLQFALACVGSSLMTEQEAEAWVATGALPAAAMTALDTLPDDGTRAAARIRFRGARVIARTDPFISVLQSALSLTDEQVDDLFFAGADL